MLREQRQLASNVALESMTLGPPIRHYINQPGNFDKFDIDIAMRERYEKQEKSLARLNVSETVAGTLGRRNPDAKCLCWKIILCSQMNSGYEIGSAGRWLASKLMPSSEDGVVISSTGLAIWRKWFSSQSGTDPTCCLSVVRDTAFGSIDETVSGASAVVFLVSERNSWKNQRVHLHNILMLIPSGARVPILILCGSADKGLSSMIISELGLQDIDKAQVSCFLLVFLIENQKVEHLSGFFSDQQLREGLQWLAGQSPVQPTIRNVNIRELVHSHLNSFSMVQDIVRDSKLGPNNCISLFNEALDCTVQEIIAAANSNTTGWPCPEIELLEESYDEDMMLKRYLPALGWSSNVKIQPIISALQKCKLPPLLDDLSWLARGYRVGHEIENQRIQLENCLIQYLTHTTKIMGVSLATKEACITTQTCARLELCDSSYRIVPHWGMIFRRIFNWRLTGLSRREISMAYIPKCHHAASLDPDVEFEASPAPSYYLNPSLDEVISVNFDSTIPVNDQPEPEALQHLPQRDSNYVNHEAANMMNAEIKLCVDKFPSINTDSKHGLNNANSEALMNGKANKETDQLSKMLEQCNLLQDGIEKKLSVYF